MTPPPASAEAARPELISAGIPAPRSAWIVRATSPDHKAVGSMFIAAALIFALLAVTELFFMRVQLLVPDATLLRPEIFDRFMTAFGVTSVLLFALPLAAGLMTYIVPLQIGARGSALPRLGQLSFWLYLFGGATLYLGFLWRPSEAGVTALAPLSDDLYSANHGVDLWIAGVALVTLGLICFAVNMLVTLRTRSGPGMAPSRLPLFAVAAKTVSRLLLVIGPVMLAALTMLMIDRNFDGIFFNPDEQGSPLLYSHLSWIFFTGAYIAIVISFFGAISEIVATFSGKPQFAHRATATAFSAIAVLGVAAWMQNMYSAPMPIGFSYFAMVCAIALIVPFGIVLVNWLKTLSGGSIRITTPMLFALGAISVATFGLLGELNQSIIPVSWLVGGTATSAGDTAYALIGSAVFGGLAALYYWLPKLTGRTAGEGIGRASFWALFVGVHLMILPSELAGFDGMPANVYKFFGDTGLSGLNALSSLGALVFCIGLVASIANLARGAVAGVTAGPDPWGANTLEWFAASPPLPHNFDLVPDVRGTEPLREIRDAVRRAEAARPATVTAGPAPSTGSTAEPVAKPTDPPAPPQPVESAPVEPAPPGASEDGGERAGDQPPVA